MITVVELEKTCDACPAQWEGKTDDGRFVYVRYRWGTLRIGVGDTEMGAVEQTMFQRTLGDGLDGSLTLDDLRRATKDHFTWVAE